MRKKRTIMDSSTAKLLIGGVAGLAALGVGQGTALAAGGNAPHHHLYTVDAAKTTMAGMPTAMTNGAASGPSSNYTTSVALHTMPTGTVTFQYRGRTLEATISALGLTPGSTHRAELTFGANRPPIAFSELTADATGQADSTIASLGPVRRLPASGTFQIELSTSPGQPIALAQLRPGSIGDAVPLQAVETSGVGPLEGHATLDYNSQAQTLTVRVDASGFVPNTSHAAHVHMGSCASQGPVVYMLPDLHADGQGRIDQTDVLQNLSSFTMPAGGWYLNIHEGSSQTILDAAGQPTPFFRPLLCADLPASSTAGSQ